MIKIKSNNKHLFSILQANPGYLEGVYPMRIKNGIGLGIVDHKANAYNILFQDTKYSYAEDMSNQLDLQSFCNSRILLDVFSECINSVFKTWDEYANQKTPWLGTGCTIRDIDIPSESSIEFNAYIDSNWVRGDGGGLFEKYFEGVKLQKIAGRAYRVFISGNMTIYRLLNQAALIAMFIAVVNLQKWKVTEQLIEKYIRVMNNIGDLPYFVVYLFKVRLLYNVDWFNKYKPDLEQIVGGKVHLSFGNTHDVRLDYICEHIDGKVSVLDVGCGEFLYAKRIMKKMKSTSIYYAHDVEDWGKVANAVNDRYKVELCFSTDLDALIEKINGAPVDVILTEVIEHNSREEAKALVLKILNTLNIRKLIVTTVNADFNAHYNLEGNVRHPDHKFEMHMDQFMSFFDDILEKVKENYDLTAFQYIQIGDSVSGESPTQGVMYVAPAFLDEKKK